MASIPPTPSSLDTEKVRLYTQMFKPGIGPYKDFLARPIVGTSLYVSLCQLVS